MDINDVQWKDAHLFAMAARQMRRVLIDAARKHRNQKRGGHFQKMSLCEELAVPDSPMSLVALDHALPALTKIDGRRGKVVDGGAEVLRRIDRGGDRGSLSCVTGHVKRD